MTYEAETQTPQYDKTFFYTIYKTSFSHNSPIEKSADQLYLSPSLFITVNCNTKQTSEWSYMKRNTDRTEIDLS
jgi:hypothetical protein